MSTVEKISKKIKKGRGVTYIVRTFSISPGANDAFDKIHAKLVKYSQKNGFKKPQVGDVMEHIIIKGNVSPKEYFNQ